MAIHDMTYTAQSMSLRCTYHLPASENLTPFLQAPLATPGGPLQAPADLDWRPQCSRPPSFLSGWTCSRGWRAWRGMDVSGVATVLAYWHGIARALGLAKARDWPAIGRKWA